MNRQPPLVSTSLSSIHTHSRYCDGHGEIYEYVEAAIAAGLSAYGASGHAPLPFPCEYAMPLANLDSYCADVRLLATRYVGRFPILLGLELDYLPGLTDFYHREFLSRQFDYFVASVHYVGQPEAEPWTYDESNDAFVQEVAKRHSGDYRPVVEDYYHRVLRLISEVKDWPMPIVIGHLDRITLWNRDDRYFPTDNAWYVGLVEEVLQEVSTTKLAVELNTSGWSKPAESPNPGLQILASCAAKSIPTIITADAHRPANVAANYGRAIDLLHRAGYSELVVPGRVDWSNGPLPES
ncbi:MAG TPA: histidinol-phosphatase [Chloroflexota bacterium]|nr:histidinol-phosphatase [Chloroflexota bacterium]